MKSRIQNFSVLLVCVLLVPMQVATAATIKKCQDADGKWHYGDTAAEECARSGVTEINRQGYKVKEQAAPKTEAELSVEEKARAAQEAERKEQARQRREDQRLLMIYETEENLIRSRDEKLAQINSAIQLNNELIKKLTANREQLRARLPATKDPKARQNLEKEISRAGDQIQRYEDNNVAKLRELEQVRTRYDQDLERFRAARDRGKDDAPQAGGTPAP